MYGVDVHDDTFDEIRDEFLDLWNVDFGDVIAK
jgi:hypothetical protein